MANVDVVNLTWDMINEKEGMIVYERTKFPKLAKPLLIDRLIVILEKYRGKGIGNYVFPVYTEKHVTDKQKMGRRNSFSTLVSETLDKVCEILGIDEKMTWYTRHIYFQRTRCGHSDYPCCRNGGQQRPNHREALLQEYQAERTAPAHERPLR